MSPSLTLLLVAALSQAEPSPEALYKTLVSADHWRQQAEAVHALGDLGEAGLPFLIQGTQHDNEKVQDWCYRELFDKFADHEQTIRAVLRGLESEHDRIRYSCCFFAGTQKIESAKETLREMYRKDKDLKLTAAKSLAQLGETDVIRTLYWSAGSDYYMPRYQANVGLKALSGRDLNDFREQTDGYDWAEAAMVSGGREVQLIPRPIEEDAKQKAQRYAALAAWSRWLKEEKPDLYAVLDPNVW